MSMTLDEAKRIAFDPIGSHATVTLDLAARVIADAGPRGRDQDCYRQLAELKAADQRAQADWLECPHEVSEKESDR